MPAMSPMQDMTCHECGYELMGLPQAGRCPECGNVYDIGTGKGLRSRASTRHARGDRAVFLFKFWGLIGLAVISMSIGMLISLVAARPMQPIATFGVITGMLLFGALAVWVLDRD